MGRKVVRTPKDIKAALEPLRTFPKAARKEVLRTMKRTVHLIEGTAAVNAPVGVSGSFRASIYGDAKINVRGDVIGTTGVDPTGAPYAAYVEKKTKPHWPPPGALLDWVRLKLGIKDPKEAKSVEFLIRRKISKKGTKGAYVFRDAFKTNAGKIRNMWKAAARNIPRRHWK